MAMAHPDRPHPYSEAQLPPTDYEVTREFVMGALNYDDLVSVRSRAEVRAALRDLAGRDEVLKNPDLLERFQWCNAALTSTISSDVAGIFSILLGRKPLEVQVEVGDERGYDKPFYADDAACKDIDDPTIFHPKRGSSAEPAKRVCYSCPQLEACADHAINGNKNKSIMGGFSERQRRRIRQKLKIENDPAGAQALREQFRQQDREMLGLADDI